MIFSDDASQTRGIGYTVWGWITYPFSWWSSESDDLSTKDGGHTTMSTTHGPYDNIEIGRRNVTVWCNEQTCTTMRCDKTGCYNMTCNIYDTDLMGECRIYNTITSTAVNLKPIEHFTQSTIEEKSETTSVKPISTTVQTESIKVEQPLELEAVMSSTIT